MVSVGSIELQRVRRERDLTQEEVAAAVSAKQESVSGWERGRCKPDRDNSQALARLYGIPVESWGQEAPASTEAAQ